MDLHVRQIFWTKDGWPVVSPERYAGTQQQKIREKDLLGEWEIITIHGDAPLRDLEAGQVLWGENLLKSEEVNRSNLVTFNKDFFVTGDKILNTFDYLEVAEFSANSLVMATSIGELQPMGDKEIDELRVAFNVK